MLIIRPNNHGHLQLLLRVHILIKWQFSLVLLMSLIFVLTLLWLLSSVRNRKRHISQAKELHNQIHASMSRIKDVTVIVVGSLPYLVVHLHCINKIELHWKWLIVRGKTYSFLFKFRRLKSVLQWKGCVGFLMRAHCYLTLIVKAKHSIGWLHCNNAKLHHQCKTFDAEWVEPANCSSGFTVLQQFVQADWFSCIHCSWTLCGTNEAANGKLSSENHYCANIKNQSVQSLSTPVNPKGRKHAGLGCSSSRSSLIPNQLRPLAHIFQHISLVS